MDKLRVAATGPLARVAALLASWRTPRPDDGRVTERGQGLAEYALILAGIAVVAIASLAFLGVVINSLYFDLIDVEFEKVVNDILGSP